MKKKLFLGLLIGLFAVFSVIANVSAIDIEVEAKEIVSVVVSELDDPAIFEFTIDNNGAADNVDLYSLVGVSFKPIETFALPSGISVKEFKAYPTEEIRAKEGTYAFEYQIKGSDSEVFKDVLAIKIVKLKNIFEISPQSIIHGSNSAVVKIRNVNNIEMNDVKFKFSSVFFEGEKTISLEPFESTDIVLSVKPNIENIAAGSYVVSLEIESDDISTEAESNVNYLQEKNVVSSKEKSGFLIVNTEITKTNEGNLVVSETTEVTKNVLTRLFTSFSTTPLDTERKGLFVHYQWENELKPGESITLSVKTNYTLPFFLVLLVILGAYFVYLYSRTNVVIKKRCSFVKTKGGEFALKVFLNLKAKKAVDNVEMFDRIPAATKLYQKAGMPHNYDEKNGKLSWKIDKLAAGEDRIFSYILYSNIKIVGRFELPSATAHFVKDGKSNYVHSNRTFFVSDISPRY